MNIVFEFCPLCPSLLTVHILNNVSFQKSLSSSTPTGGIVWLKIGKVTRLTLKWNKYNINIEEGPWDLNSL
jgi:hypothetical protein